MIYLKDEFYAVHVVVRDAVYFIVGSLLKEEYFQELNPQSKILVVYEINSFVLHVCDRELLFIFGPEKRGIIMDKVLEIISERVKRQCRNLQVKYSRKYFQNIYNERQIEYSFYKELLPDKGKPLKYTLAWEFSKNALLHMHPTPDEITRLAVNASGVAASCMKTLRELKTEP